MSPNFLPDGPPANQPVERRKQARHLSRKTSEDDQANLFERKTRLPDHPTQHAVTRFQPHSLSPLSTTLKPF